MLRVEHEANNKTIDYRVQKAQRSESKTEWSDSWIGY